MPWPLSLTVTSTVVPAGHARAATSRFAGGIVLHGVQGVEQQVKQNLLQLHPVAMNSRQGRVGLQRQPHPARLGIRPHQGDDFARQQVKVEAAAFDRPPLYQRAHPIDHFARAVVVLADVGQNSAHFVEVWRGLLEQQLPGLGVAQDGAERLVQFVRERGGQLAHGGDAGNVNQFVALLHDLLLRQLALGDVRLHRSRVQDRSVFILHGADVENNDASFTCPVTITISLSRISPVFFHRAKRSSILARDSGA